MARFDFFSQAATHDPFSVWRTVRQQGAAVPVMGALAPMRRADVAALDTSRRLQATIPRQRPALGSFKRVAKRTKLRSRMPPWNPGFA